jgi:hypothetical protein
LDFALAKAGKSRLARIAMIAMTTSNSIRVKPLAKPVERRLEWALNRVFIFQCETRLAKHQVKDDFGWL